MSVRIGDLDSISTLYDSDSLVIEQNGVTKRLPGSVLRSWLDYKIQGHGGIDHIDGPVHRDGVDYYTIVWTRATDPVQEFGITSAAVDTYRVEYQAGTSGTVPPTGTWKTDLTQVTVNPGQYLWTRTRIKWNSGTEEVGYSVGYHGLNGNGSGTVTSINGATPDNTGAVTLSMEPEHFWHTVTIGPTTTHTTSATYDDYPYRYDITISGATITANTHARIVFPVSLAAIAAPVCETHSGGIYIWLSDVPEAAGQVQVEYWGGAST